MSSHYKESSGGARAWLEASSNCTGCHAFRYLLYISQVKVTNDCENEHNKFFFW